jgi:NADP-dependent 3-hydroxy acid dehydrogenase YdfG
MKNDVIVQGYNISAMERNMKRLQERVVKLEEVVKKKLDIQDKLNMKNYSDEEFQRLKEIFK